MVIVYNIVEEVPNIFYQDSMWFWAIFLPLVILGNILGLYIFFRIKKSNPMYWLFKIWHWGMIVIPVIVGFGYGFCFMNMKKEVLSYSNWLATKDYTITKGTIEIVEKTLNPLKEVFVVNEQSFDTDINPWLLGRHDILETGKKVRVTSHESIVLLIEQ